MISAMHFFRCVAVLAAFGVNYSGACDVMTCFDKYYDSYYACSGFTELQSCVEAELPNCSPGLTDSIQSNMEFFDQRCGSTIYCSLENILLCQDTPIPEHDATTEEKCRYLRNTRLCLGGILPWCLPEDRGLLERFNEMSLRTCPENMH